MARTMGSEVVAKLRETVRMARSPVRAIQRMRNRHRPRGSGVRPPSAPYHLVSSDPVVIYATSSALAQSNPPILDVLEAVSDRPAHMLYCPWWHVGAGRRMARLTEFLDDLHRTFPRLRVVVTAPTELTRSQFAVAGLDAIHVNQNALVDVNRFDIEEREKRYDAVYTARMAAFKRFELARSIDSLALICQSRAEILDSPYGKRVRRQLNHASWVCHGPDGPRRLSPAEVSEVLNQSRVGLALSAEEGAMYASIEYPLSGLPVVTTPSRGGRHEFFDPAFTVTVDPTPAAVAAGVQEAIAANLDPNQIRKATLRKVQEHRDRFVGAIQEIYDDAGVGRDFANEWDDVFVPMFYARVLGREAVDAYNETIITKLVG